MLPFCFPQYSSLKSSTLYAFTQSTEASQLCSCMICRGLHACHVWENTHDAGYRRRGVRRVLAGHVRYVGESALMCCMSFMRRTLGGVMKLLVNSQPLVEFCTPVTVSLYPFSLLLAAITVVSCADPLRVLGRAKKKWVSVLHRWGSWALAILSLSPWEKLQTSVVSFGTELCCLGEEVMQVI